MDLSTLQENDRYFTIAKPLRTEIKIKGSKFIASVSSVSDKTSALEFLEAIRSEFFDATHNCFAYRIGFDGMEFRSSDDGEPSGSAGKPILFTLKKFDYSDIIVVVTRYFGGTKLGVGGLARAYSGSAADVLAKCERNIIPRTIPVKVFCTYEDVSRIKKLTEDNSIRFEENYADVVEYLAYIPLSKIEYFTAKVNSLTNGRAGTLIQQ